MTTRPYMLRDPALERKHGWRAGYAEGLLHGLGIAGGLALVLLFAVWVR